MSSRDHPRHSAETDLSAPDLAALQALAEPNRVRIVELLAHGKHLRVRRRRRARAQHGPRLAPSPGLGFSYEDAVAVAFNSTGRDFEIAIAIAITAVGPTVARATVVGPLIEFPVMLALVWGAMRLRRRLFGPAGAESSLEPAELSH